MANLKNEDQQPKPQPPDLSQKARGPSQSATGADPTSPPQGSPSGSQNSGGETIKKSTP